METSIRKPIDKAVADNADMIVSFKPAQELPEFVRQRSVHYWNVADPARQSIAFHRKTRDLVKSNVESLLAEI